MGEPLIPNPEEQVEAVMGTKAAEELMDLFDGVIEKYSLDKFWAFAVAANVFSLTAAECGATQEAFDAVADHVKSDFVKYKAMIEDAKGK